MIAIDIAACRALRDGYAQRVASRGSIHGAVNIADVQRISIEKTAHFRAALVLGVDFSPESPRFVSGVRRHILLPIVCA